jgi:hypothetical protein
MVSTGLVMALVGSFLTMLVVSASPFWIFNLFEHTHPPNYPIFEILQTFILPCACFLSIVRGKITLLQVSGNSFTGYFSYLINHWTQQSTSLLYHPNVKTHLKKWISCIPTSSFYNTDSNIYRLCFLYNELHS